MGGSSYSGGQLTINNASHATIQKRRGKFPLFAHTCFPSSLRLNWKSRRSHRKVGERSSAEDPDDGPPEEGCMGSGERGVVLVLDVSSALTESLTHDNTAAQSHVSHHPPRSSPVRH